MLGGTGFRAGLASSAHAAAEATTSPLMGERVIMLLDYDSFYARCMQQAYPPLRGKPVGIRGPAKGTAIIAASTEAKRRGVTVGCHINEAYRICPGFVPVHADMDMYGEICARSLCVLSRYTDKIEPFSIDEAYLDVTDLAAEFGDPSMLAQHIKRDLCQVLGDTITCSIGIGPNKLIAKLVSSFHKPDGITHVPPAEVPAVLRDTALTDLCGIGARVERRLHRLGVYTIEQLGRIPVEVLVREFGVLGRVYALWGHGIDLAPVQPYRQQAAEKSMGHHLTLPDSVSQRTALNGVLMRLCERLARRLRRRGMLTRQVHMGLGWDRDFAANARVGGMRNLPRATDDGLGIYEALQALLPPGVLPAPVRRVFVTVTRLTRDAVQLSLWDDLVKRRAAQAAMDAVNDRFGERTIVHGKAMHDPFPIRTGPPGHGLCKRFPTPEETEGLGNLTLPR